MSSEAMVWEREFQERLDRDARKRAAAHKQAVEAAAKEHDRVREVAEAVRRQADLQAAIDKQRETEAQLAELERIQRLAEEETRAAEEARQRRMVEAENAKREAETKRARAEAAAEADRKRREEQEREQAEIRRQQDEAAAQAQRQREADEQAKKLAAQEAIRKAQEAKKAVNTPTAPSQPLMNGTAPMQSAAPSASASASVSSGLQPADPDKEKTHKRYLEIHKNMKDLRKWMAEQGKANPALKTAMGDGRREIRKNIGQLTGDVKKNSQQRERITKILVGGTQFSQPVTDITMFLHTPPDSASNTQVPALLIYLMNIFIKALMRQFVGEGGVKLSTANPVGIVGSAVLANNSLQWNGIPLTDMLVAKFHVVCPLLFGIYGPENTDEGKRRIGWKFVKDASGKSGSFVSAQDHADRMTGFGAGFAALSLRNYERTKATNPYPPWHYWHAVACITNIPAGAIQPSHCYVLRAMMQDNEGRILEFFGDFGVLLMKYALVAFPKKAPQNSPATQQLSLIAGQLAKDRKLYLEG